MFHSIYTTEEYFQLIRSWIDKIKWRWYAWCIKEGNSPTQRWKNQWNHYKKELWPCNLPPLLSLSAGFTWIGRFICKSKKKKRNCNVASKPHSFAKYYITVLNIIKFQLIRISDEWIRNRVEQLLVLILNGIINFITPIQHWKTEAWSNYETEIIKGNVQNIDDYAAKMIGWRQCSRRDKSGGNHLLGNDKNKKIEDGFSFMQRMW